MSVSPDRRRVCLFAQFDPQGRIRPHVLHYLGALRACGFEVVMAASGDRPPSGADLRAAASLGVQVIPRLNAGLDFGAWRDLIRAGHADGAGFVLLANDSVYGPIGHLRPVLRRMSVDYPDAWGMVESNQGGWHLQSWFIHMTAAALASPAVRRVFDQPFERMAKAEIIVRGELALGAALRVEGLRCRAVHAARDATAMARLVPSNAMHLDWQHLVATGKVPFVKVELLRDNPSGIQWVRRWPAVIDRRSYPVAWIHAHLLAYTGQAAAAVAGAEYVTPLPRLGWKIHLFQMAATRDRGTAVLTALLGAQLTAGKASKSSRNAPIAVNHSPENNQGEHHDGTRDGIDVDV